MKKYKLAVIGAGSAGIQSACNFLYKLDARWEVSMIYNPNIKTLGHIESTNPGFVSAIAFGANYDVVQDAPVLDSKLKFGTLYKDWREYDFVNPLVTGIAAMNFDTKLIHDFLFPRMHEEWGEKFVEIQGNVTHVEDYKNHAIVKIDDNDYKFDFVIDCRGFSNINETDEDVVYLDKHPVNRCLVHMKKETVDVPYTSHYATPDGWMWEIPLYSRTNYGYTFNDKITTVEQAKKNFSKQINVDIDELDLIEYKFKTRYNKKIFKHRVIKNGLNAAFFEPMFSNSLWLYDNIDQHIFDYIQSHSSIEEIKDKHTIDYYNNEALFNMKEVEDLLYYCYHGGSTYNTDFWSYTKEYATEMLMKSENLKRVTPVLRDMTKNKHRVGDAVWFYGPLNLIKIDRNFGYNYFVEA